MSGGPARHARSANRTTPSAASPDRPGADSAPLEAKLASFGGQSQFFGPVGAPSAGAGAGRIDRGQLTSFPVRS